MADLKCKGPLAEDIKAYLGILRKSGPKADCASYFLASFDHFLAEIGARSGDIPEEAARAWLESKDWATGAKPTASGA
jgi:hypothetical protein